MSTSFPLIWFDRLTTSGKTTDARLPLIWFDKLTTSGQWNSVHPGRWKGIFAEAQSNRNVKTRGYRSDSS